jgi:hypothetical protein
MRKQRTRLVLGLAAVVALATMAAQARADIYMKQKMHTGSVTVMGQTQPEKDQIMVFWLGANSARTDTEPDNTSMIFLSDKKILYMIDHAKKQYSEMPLDFSKMFDERAAEAGQDEDKEKADKVAGMMKGMMKGLMGNMSAKVTETNEAKKIGNWDCRKYLIEIDMGMGKSHAEAWATEDLKIDYTMAFTMTNAMMAGMPGFEKIVAEMKKVKGVVVQQTAKVAMMGTEVVSTTELLEAGEKPAPAGHYDLPAGYKKVKGFGR